jgi:hypothetical protein
MSEEFTFSNGVFSLEIAGPVPVPPSVVLLGSGLLGLMGFGWRPRKS